MRALAEIPWLGPVMSAILVAMFVNLLTDSIVEWGGHGLGWAAIALVGVFALLFVYGYNISELRRRGRGLGRIVDVEEPVRHRGLIFMFSKADTLREAIRHHKASLEQCWLLVTPEMQPAAQHAIGNLAGIKFSMESIPHRYHTEACYLAVRNIYARDAPRLGIPPEQVIMDITGGTKPMTMGAIVACLEGGFPIEHVPTEYDAAGNAKGPLPPIEIRVQSPAIRAHHTMSAPAPEADR